MDNYSFAKASAQHRLGGKALDLLLYFVTLGIGWIVWSVVVWGRGQTPGKQLLKLRAYDKITGNAAGRGHMAVREFLLPGFFSIVAACMSIIPVLQVQFVAIYIFYLGTFIALIDAFWILRGDKRNRLVDVFAKTDVLNEAVLKQ